jgi:hypothetical protein
VAVFVRQDAKMGETGFHQAVPASVLRRFAAFSAADQNLILGAG